MSHVSYTELRQNLAKYMDEVCDSRSPIHVTRQNARSVVMLSEEEYSGMVETLHLLRSPANAERLLRSIRNANTGKLRAREITKRRTRAE
jgi:antitoxin YefM